MRVSYSTKASRKLEVSLKNPAQNYAWQGGATVDVAAGTGSVVVAVPINANASPGKGFVYTARLNEMSGALLQEVIQKNISIGAASPTTGAK